MKKLAISIRTPELAAEPPLALAEGSFRERLMKAAAWGYTGVELVVEDPARLDSAALLAELTRAGLSPAAVASGYLAKGPKLTLTSPDPAVRDAACERLLAMVRLAAGLGCGIVTIGSFRGSAAAAGGLDKAAACLHAALHAAAPLCEQSGVCLALEAINAGELDFLNNADEVVRFLDEGGHRRAGLLLDSFHIDLGEPEGTGAILRYAPQLIHFHLADSARRALGEGSIDFAAMEQALREAGYDGWQSAELARAADPDGNAARSAAHILKLMK